MRIRITLDFERRRREPETEQAQAYEREPDAYASTERGANMEPHETDVPAHMEDRAPRARRAGFGA